MLEFKNVTIMSGESCVVNGLSFMLDAGKSLLVAGSHTPYKEAFVDVLLGLCAPSAGYITIGGSQVTPVSAPHFRRIMGYVAQETALPYSDFATLTAALFGLTVNGGKKPDTALLFEEWQTVGLDKSLYTANLDSLAADELQMMMISVVWLMGKKILVVDGLASSRVACYAADMAKRGLCVVAIGSADMSAEAFDTYINIDKLAI